LPFNLFTGAYTQINGATNASNGQIIQAPTWDSIFTDIGTSLQQLTQGTVPVLLNMSFHNALARNGSLDIWQRGAGSAAAITVTGAATAYTADGWYLVANANQTLVASAQAALTAGSQLCGRVARGNGNTGVGAIVFAFPLDVEEVAAMAGNPCSLRFAAQAGANFSPASGNVVVQVFTGTGAPVKQVNGTYAGSSVIMTSTIAVGTSTTVVQINGATVAAATKQMEVQFSWTPVGTAGANDWVEFDDVQLEPNAVSTLYDRIPFDTALLRCMRQYEKTFPYASVAAQSGGSIGAMAVITPVVNSAMSYNWQFRVPKRVAPTVTLFNPSSANANARNITDGADVVATLDSSNTPSADRSYVTLATVAGASKTILLHAVADAGI
jgi:hypothetical protein